MSHVTPETENQRLERLGIARGRHPDPLEDRFGPGTHGHHEALDRTSLVSSMFSDFVEDHPAVLLDPEAYALAAQAADFMAKLYCHLGSKD